MHIKRFEGIEMKPITHIDANIALSLILLLMLSLLGMNAAYYQHQTAIGQAIAGTYPVGQFLATLFSGLSSVSAQCIPVQT